MKTIDIISIIVPLTSLAIILFVAFNPSLTGYTIVDDSYSIKGKIIINAPQELPLGSNIKVSIGNYTRFMNITKHQANSYSIDLTAIDKTFRKGNYWVSIQILNNGSVLYNNNTLITI